MANEDKPKKTPADVTTDAISGYTDDELLDAVYSSTDKAAIINNAISMNVDNYVALLIAPDNVDATMIARARLKTILGA